MIALLENKFQKFHSFYRERFVRFIYNGSLWKTCIAKIPYKSYNMCKRSRSKFSLLIKMNDRTEKLWIRGSVSFGSQKPYK